MIKTAVVVLNWNGRKLLEEFLPSVVNHSNIPDTKIYLVDNGSTDDSVEYVKTTFNEVEVIVFDKNYGFTGGYNKALKEISAEYFVILNSDVQVTENWLQPIIELMDSDKSIAAAMPKIKDYKDKTKFEYAGACGGFIDYFGYPFCRGRIFNDTEQDNGQYNQAIDVFWATGACLFIRSEHFINNDGFDPDFFAHMEEIDLCWRLKNQGYRLVCEPKSVVYHLGGGTLSELNPKKIYLNHRNNLFLLIKNLPKNKTIPILFIRMILDGAAAFSYLAKGKPKFFVAVIKAHFSFYSRIGYFYKKRSKTISTHPEMHKKSIVKQYFLEKKKRYSDL